MHLDESPASQLGSDVMYPPSGSIPHATSDINQMVLDFEETPLSTYEEWTKNRQVISFGTNDGARPLAFQAWHHFKEAFPPELIKHAIEHSRLAVSSCLDPFGGSGTTALACQMLEVDSTTIEVNPFLADVIRAKLARYDVDSLISSLARVRHLSRRHDGLDATQYFAGVPATFLEPGKRGRWIFDLHVADRLAAILSAIEEVEDFATRRLFKVLVGGILSQVSNVVVSGKGRRYRRKWMQVRCSADRVDLLFAQRAERAIMDIQQFGSRFGSRASVVHGDARDTLIETQHQIAVMSPPYPNSFDYTDVYNLELWMLGYLKEAIDNKRLRDSTLTSHVQLLRSYAKPPLGSETLSQVCADLEAKKEELWSPWIPSMIGGYFADLLKVLGRVKGGLSDNGLCWMVVGDSRYSGVSVQVAKILGELAPTCGWDLESSVPFRHMKSSAQQGWRAELAESLLTLRKVQ